LLALAGLSAALLGCLNAPPSSVAQARGTQSYLFCFWNAENFFDDKVNGWKTEPDRAFDTWFARDPKAFQRKLENLTEVLAALNDRKGPDILALAEVETERAAQLLTESLNQAIGRRAPPYQHVLMKNPHGGRNIATAIITRLNVDGPRTQLLGKRQRILEGHVEVNGHDLVILATHWTSRVSDQAGEGRKKYADQIYGRFLAMYKSNPRVDLLVCGDFNDNPDDPSVTEHLHATGDLDKVRQGGDRPSLFNLFAKRWERDRGKGELGTHFYRGKTFIFDQIVLSPGLLDDKGWSWDGNPAQIVRQIADDKGRPLKFGTEKEKRRRGASDHFPVTVRLNVAPQ
jgi:endonuclease/exonuclease/phosphatase family metal-dependent hydrolase